MELTQEIFRAYDIRGVYPEQLDNGIAREIGRGIGSMLLSRGAKNIVVGRDNRPSSLFLSSNLIEGLLSTGCNVTHIGITIQPIIHFLTFMDEFDAGVNLTASHNPKKYNGIKVEYSDAKPMFGDELQELYRVVMSGKFESGKGVFREKDYRDLYINYFKEKFRFEDKLKVLIDCGNGAASVVAPEIFKTLGIDVIAVNSEYDSDFPNEVPNPEDTVFQEELKTKMREVGADVGFGYDGDGDRLGVVDENGTIYKSDELIMLFASDILEKESKQKIVYDVKCSSLLEGVIKERGGIPHMIRTGRAYFLNEVLNGDAAFGGEFSGHFYFKDDYFGYDDAVYASCRVLSYLLRKDRSLSNVMSEFPKAVNTPEIKIGCPDNKKFELITELIRISKSDASFKSIVDIDGVRANVSDTGWFLIRASNTGAYLSVRMEGKDNEEVSLIINKVTTLLGQYEYLDLSGLK